MLKETNNKWYVHIFYCNKKLIKIYHAQYDAKVKYI
jgi:hypothetical protein